MATASQAIPQETRPTSFNLYGMPGLIDMPTAEAAPDATLSATVGHFGDTTRTTLAFQITPRLSGSFRYSRVADFYPTIDGAPWTDPIYYDRSFDLRYQLVEETATRPGVAVGLQDFIGTGLYGAEYIVASKAVTPGLRLTGGVGWGRLGTANSIGSTGSRPNELLGEGGVPTYDRWFRGPVGAFGGLAWSPMRNLTFKAEYSSDAYVNESTDGNFEHASPWNFGMDYRLKNGAQLSLYHLYGNTVGFQVSFHTNLKTAQVPGGLEPAPVPVKPRNPADINDLGWTNDSELRTSTRNALAKAMAREELVYEGLELEPRRAVLRMRNPTFDATPQAIGRAARVMTRVLPASVEEFVIIPSVNGMAASAVVMQRSDVERLENEDAAEMLARTAIRDGYGLAPPPERTIYPRFSWSLLPYVSLSAFDPDNPLRADVGIRAKADYRITPNWVLSGSVAKKLGGNLDSITREGTSGLPYVRTDAKEYSRQGDPAIEHLTLAYYGRPAQNLYSRVTAGYLEKMYAGVSGEVLWKPVDSRLALGVEVNYVQPRDFDQLFGLRSRETGGGTIPEVNGHVSAYYAFGNGFHGQLDVGRYLAGDFGATVALDREFGNGWRVGAYATVTDASSEEFGEGSFDKGIRITIPLSTALNRATRGENTVTIQSLTRDGGARLNVNGRLYEQVRDYHRPEMEKTWGRVWR
ncbi:YjbH domain-containing protein [Aquicoccus sp. SCR17]|nr:YjbH domain-containing protein [Carideicomes alvinocaridis]